MTGPTANTTGTPQGVPVSRSGLLSRMKAGMGPEQRLALIFVAPFMVLLLVFIVLPALTAVVLSLTDTSIRDLRHLTDVSFVGFDTFSWILTDPDFQQALWNTGLMVVIGVPLTMAIGFGLAQALNTGARRLMSIYRSAFYLPVITNVVAAAMIWQYAFTLQGPVNTMLAHFGIQGPNWYNDSHLSMGLVIAMTAWRNVGTCMVLYLAGLQNISPVLYEAAKMDGAGPVRIFFTVTLPGLFPTTVLVTVLMTVCYMNIFDEPYLLTKGGPVGSTTSLGLWIYQQFGYGNIAEAMSGAVVLLILIGVLAVVQLLMMRRALR